MNRPNILAAACALATLAACGGSSDKKTPPQTPPDVVLETFQDASLAIGQASLTAVTHDTCTATSLDAPYGAAAWDGTRLYVSDTNGNRVHAYTGIPATSGATPAFSLGTADCSVPATPSAADFVWPQSVRTLGAGGSGKLVVTDSINNRVLVFAGIPSASPASAAAAVGQADLATWDPSCDDRSLAAPQSAFVTAGGKLIVADQGNNRVLVWNAIPTASDAPADLVLGQVSMDSCRANDDPLANFGDVTEVTLNAPSDVWSDGTRLVVVDSGNNRVLVWSTFPTTDGEAADAVIGQAAFDTATPGLGDTAMASPFAVASDGTRLFVADQGNNRVLAFDAIPASGPGAAATVVLGQAGFTSGSANAGGAVTAATLSNPSGLAVIDGALFVTDSGNHRVLISARRRPEPRGRPPTVRPDETTQEKLLPLSTDLELRRRFMVLNEAIPGNLRFGMLLEELDWLAFETAIAYARRSHASPRVVTAALDEIVVRHVADVTRDVRCRAQINYVGRTSMEVGIRVESSPGGEHLASCYFTMVARDGDGPDARNLPVPPLEIAGRHRRAARGPRRGAARAAPPRGGGRRGASDRRGVQAPPGAPPRAGGAGLRGGARPDARRRELGADLSRAGEPLARHLRRLHHAARLRAVRNLRGEDRSAPAGPRRGQPDQLLPPGPDRRQAQRHEPRRLHRGAAVCVEAEIQRVSRDRSRRALSNSCLFTFLNVDPALTPRDVPAVYPTDWQEDARWLAARRNLASLHARTHKGFFAGER